ncbi:radical SAM family heme chaperone HemW [Paenibacillus doosanensis]|uniref:Heme chaperone HemW n=1 Tax=Paenibacillus konkukensis TaxID=2020716 RepID=A0ABY4RWD1_9BACL|nr:MULTISPECIES: radical SAM family heme chaperone HemW [Paenibacillus]MCS7458513.1 radical SAM family heme chaperone HemW [Paenibacillus doosanensis]UQZ86964.1 Oxygen-independent coproporphyrinogen-III oxidase 1 [Paenibacillus konkukensis]
MIQRQETPQAVYIHIPFCTNKCHYCDFNSYVLKGQPVMDYLDALEREMERTVAAVPPQEIETIFVGGGTPTVLLPDQMASFLRRVNAYFPRQSPQIEFSMEANPGTTDLEKLQAMKEGGVNRISFGVQSFDNALLEGIGRIHNTDDVYRSLENARKAGFTNMSIDLMFGLPKQTVQTMHDTLDKALALDLPHYSIYSLKVEENTLFHTLYQKNQLPLPEEDEELDMFLLIMERLKQAGYTQYEISNFAKPGYESRHNSMYWLNRSYYGLGAGAHGYTYGRRHVNIKGVQPYIDATRRGLPLLEEYEISRQDAMEDFMMVGLRLLRGVTRSDFRRQFGSELESVFGDVLKKLLGLQLLEETEDGYKLSDKGVLYGNEVFGEFLSV